MTTTRIATADRDALIRKLMAENPDLPAMKMTDLIKDALGIGKERAYHYYRATVHAGVEGRGIRDRAAEKAAKAAEPKPEKPAKVKAEKPVKPAKVANTTKPVKSAEEVATAKAKNLAAIKAAAEKAGKAPVVKDPAASMDEVDEIVKNILGDDKPEDIVPKFLQKDLGVGEFRGADAE